MDVKRRLTIAGWTCLIALAVLSPAIVKSMQARKAHASRKAPEVSDPALRDFRARCQAPGVTKCVDFDSDAWVQHGVYLYPAWDGAYRGTKDTSIQVSGTGSLRFEFPGRSAANGAGFWSMGFGKNFSEHSTFFVQYRMRLNDAMVHTDWNEVVGSSWKQSIFHSRGVTCGNVEITVGRYGWNGVSGFPIMYTECGGRGMSTNKGDPPTKVEQGDYNCWYGRFNSSDCFYYPANEWMTFYFRVTVGTWGKPDSYIQAWVARQGKPPKKWVEMPNFLLNKDNDGSSYNWITLLPYMTNKNLSADHPTAYMWFDELIISTQPIPPPGASGQ